MADAAAVCVDSDAAASAEEHRRLFVNEIERFIAQRAPVRSHLLSAQAHANICTAHREVCLEQKQPWALRSRPGFFQINAWMQKYELLRVGDEEQLVFRAEIKRRQRLLSAAQEPRYAPDNTRMASAYEVAFDHVSSGGTPRNEIEHLVQWEQQEEQLGTIEEGEHGAAHSGAEGEHGAAHSGAAEPRRRQGLKRGRGQVCLDAVSTCLQE